MKKLLSILLFGILCGQEYSLSGVVLSSDSNSPIVDANIFISDSTIGSASDIQGNFKIDELSDKNYTIIASALGYKDTVLSINPSSLNNIIIKLIPSSIM